MKPVTYQVLLLTMFGMFGSMLVGLIFFGTMIFHSQFSRFQFIASGFYGSLFFAFLKFKTPGKQLLTAVTIFVVQLLIFTGRGISAPYIIRDFFSLGFLFLSIKLYYVFITRYPRLTYYFRVMILIFFTGLLYIVSAVIVFWLNAGEGIPPITYLMQRAREGALVALGIGLGIDFYLQNAKEISHKLRIRRAGLS